MNMMKRDILVTTVIMKLKEKIIYVTRSLFTEEERNIYVVNAIIRLLVVQI